MAVKEKTTITYIPAAAGWFLVGPVYNDIEVCAVYYEPILAWELETSLNEKIDIETFCMVNPVTVEGKCDSEFAIQRPDKTIVVQCVQELKSESDAIEFFNKQHALREKRKQSKIAKASK